MAWVLKVRVPVDFVLSTVGRDHLPKARGDSRPEVRVKLGCRARLEWNLLHLQKLILGLAAQLAGYLMENVGRASLPQSNSTLLRICHRVEY